MIMIITTITLIAINSNTYSKTNRKRNRDKKINKNKKIEKISQGDTSQSVN